MFRIITKPIEQIETAEQFLRMLLIDIYNLREEQICITISRKNPLTSDWLYIIDSQDNWKKTDIMELMKNDSAAKNAIETGQPCLFLIKTKHVKVGIILYHNMTNYLVTEAFIVTP